MTQNSSTAENFIRSANDPTISPQVIAAKVAWNAMNTYSGIFTPSLKVSASESGVTPFRKIFSNEPKNCPVPVKARL
jgi:hypothetical protein